MRGKQLAMACKLIDSAQARWRAAKAPHRVAPVRAGAVFHKGKLLERPIDITPTEPDGSTETEVAQPKRRSPETTSSTGLDDIPPDIDISGTQYGDGAAQRHIYVTADSAWCAAVQARQLASAYVPMPLTNWTGSARTPPEYKFGPSLRWRPETVANHCNAVHYELQVGLCISPYSVLLTGFSRKASRLPVADGGG